MKNFHDLTKRAKEPSTYAGLAGLAISVCLGIDDQLVKDVLIGFASLCSILGVGLKEQQK